MTYHCPNCTGFLSKAVSMNGGPSEFWYECNKCNALYNSYHPMTHQLAVHNDPTLNILNAGGYGTGKTTTSRQEVYRHALLTPNGNTLIGAKVTSQYEQTIKREIENDLPAILVSNVSAQKAYIELVNGHRIIFRPFDDPDKLRSYNISMFVIIEASETPAETFHQLKTRLRNTAAISADRQHDWRRGIIETNPSAGWVREDALLNAHAIHTYGSVFDIFNNSLTPDHNISAHITATDANFHLPQNFIEEVSKNKPSWWVSKFIHGSFHYAEGIVYPAAGRAIVPTTPIPKHWKRLVSCDYGLSDIFAYVAAAIDPDNNCVYIYRTDGTTDMNIEELSERYYRFTEDIPQGGLYTQPILDPKSGAKRDYNKKTLYDHFMDYGIYFKPGHISVAARIFRMNTWLESGKLKIMDCCEGLITELFNYKFPERTLDSRSRSFDKPIDKDNHYINAAEWICMELPADPAKLNHGAYDLRGNLIDDAYLSRKREQQNSSWQLADDQPDFDSDFNTFELFK